MNIDDALELAQNNTQILRSRKNLLYTFGATRLPYICLSQSNKNQAEVNIREGEITADKPKISLPGEVFKFEGFDKSLFPESETEDEITVLLARRISMPPANYVNKSVSEHSERNSLDNAIDKVINRLDQQNDVRTAVIAAPDQVWNISILLYVGSQIVRSAPSNVHEHFERIRLRGL